MCGIVGYVGPRPAVDVLINGLKRLEYRGYDSAGVAVVRDEALEVIKNAGKVKSLADEVYGSIPHLEAIHTGIAHTRWATHGPPTQLNAHPLLDQDRKIAIVHNGIIDNYAEIAGILRKDGCALRSETDSEVIAHRITRIS
jgi:glucosamine--fructose-6-phosphate aminotransferase (isomerizing)